MKLIKSGEERRTEKNKKEKDAKRRMENKRREKELKLRKSKEML